MDRLIKPELAGLASDVWRLRRRRVGRTLRGLRLRFWIDYGFRLIGNNLSGRA